METILKEAKYYITGFTAITLFIYLLAMGEKEMASQLFQNLILVFALIFGIQSNK